MLKRTFVALAIAAVAVGAAWAQESVTLTLRSGERLSGHLVDLGGVGFTMRVDGQERRIPKGDVALIDFSGSSMSQADWDRVSGGQHIIWLRNGDTFSGQLVDVSGGTPKRLTIRTDTGERNLSANEVARIAMARPTSTGTATTGSAGGGQTITVSARQQWTPTGITLRRGERVTVNASGEIRLSGDPNDIATASGVKNQRFDPGAPLPRTLAGALIGRIGNGRPFGIGTQNSFEADAGQLFLGINDSNLTDNEGEFHVEIQLSGGPVRRR